MREMNRKKVEGRQDVRMRGAKREQRKGKGRRRRKRRKERRRREEKKRIERRESKKPFYFMVFFFSFKRSFDFECLRDGWVGKINEKKELHRKGWYPIGRDADPGRKRTDCNKANGQTQAD